MAPVDLVGRDAEALLHDPTHPVGREEPIVATQHEPRRHVGPTVERPRVGHRSVGLLWWWLGEGFGGDLRRHVVEEVLDDVELGRATLPLGQLDAAPAAGRCCPTTRRRSRLGRGIIAVRRTSRSTGRRVQTIGALNPASDWATRTRFGRSPTASTIAST